mgnify:CR=1 FL=1
MKRCRKCKGELVDEAMACIHCGARTKESADAPSAAVALLCFPLVGLALYCALDGVLPLRARSAKRGLYAGLAGWVLFCIVVAVWNILYLFS